jgi:7-carboxy-7-deazaguanine synthase
MKIAEVFYSIQGEGTLAGVPSVFVRTSGCNLRCTWCDTPYTSWRPEGVEMSNTAILDEIAKYPARHTVVTGGEPMLFAPVVPLTAALRKMGQHITIETAGTVYQPVACDLMSISPKLANSTPDGEWSARHDATRYQPDVLKRLMAEFEYQLKFVVATASDMDEVQSMLTELDADRSRVLLMPEGTTPEVTRERAQWLAEICKREGFRYSARLHVDIWGDKRGV